MTQGLFFTPPRNELAYQGAPEYTGVSYHTSAQGIPIPIMWGTRRIAPQIIWQSDTTLNLVGDPVSSVVFPTSGPYGELGSGDRAFNGNLGLGVGGPVTDEGTHWWVPTYVAFGEGPIIAFNTLPNGRVWLGGGGAPIKWSQTFTNNGGNTPVGFITDIQTGTMTQAVPTFFTASPGGANASLYPGQDLAYRGTAYIVYGLLNTGNNNVIPQVSYEVQRIPNSAFAVTDSYSIGKDYNFADMIPDLLTSTQYGVGGFTGSDIDTASLATFFEYTAAPGLYVSPLLEVGQ